MDTPQFEYESPAGRRLRRPPLLVSARPGTFAVARRHRALIGIAMLLLVGAAGCGSAHPAAKLSASATPPAATGSPSPVAPTGLLYSGKSATFSSVWATEHDCPVNVYIDVTDSGPQLRNPDTSGGGTAVNGAAWPKLKWSPPCAGITQEIDFDGASVAKVSGSQTQASCQAGAEQSRRDGNALPGYRLSALAVGAEFCEYYQVEHSGSPLDRVILMRVESVSATNPIKVTWSFTDWALASTAPAAPASAGDPLYVNQTFVVGDRKDCVPAAVDLEDTSGPIVNYGTDQSSGNVVFFPACLGGGATIRFGDPAAPVNGDPAVAACEDAAAGSGRNSLDVDLAALHPGDEYCVFGSQLKTVILVKVVSITRSPVVVTFSATGWKAPV